MECVLISKVITFGRMDCQPCTLASPACVQLNRETEFPLSSSRPLLKIGIAIQVLPSCSALVPLKVKCRDMWDSAQSGTQKNTVPPILQRQGSSRVRHFLDLKNNATIRTAFGLIGLLYGHKCSKSTDQPGKVANPARGQLNRKIEFFPVRVRA